MQGAPGAHNMANNQIQPSFVGIILSSRDALLLFTAAYNEIIPMIGRRPHDKERASSIVSGNIFIYCEQGSSIKRWTDGVTWSPSRIMGNFLIYRELNKGFPPGEKKRAAKRRNHLDPNLEHGHEIMDDHPYSNLPPLMMSKDQERTYIGSLVDSYDFKHEGLVKKTISVKIKEKIYHLVSYYTLRHAASRALTRPSDCQSLVGMAILDDLVNQQAFRVAVDENGIDLSSSNTGHNTPSPQLPQHASMSPVSPSMGINRNIFHAQNEEPQYTLHPYHQPPSYSHRPVGRYDNQRDQQISYDQTSVGGYQNFMSNSGRNDDIYGAVRSDNIPRSQISSYAMPPASDYQQYPENPHHPRQYTITVGQSLEPSNVMQPVRSPPYGVPPVHYGMTEPSAYANGMNMPRAMLPSVHPMASISGIDRNAGVSLQNGYNASGRQDNNSSDEPEEDQSSSGSPYRPAQEEEPSNSHYHAPHNWQ